MGLFGRNAKRERAEASGDLLVHHQFLTAMHQYCTEVWNDALELVSSEFEPGDEILNPGIGVVRHRPQELELLKSAVQIQETVFSSAGRLHQSWCDNHRQTLEKLPDSATDLLDLAGVLVEAAGIRARWRALWIESPNDPEILEEIEDAQRLVQETSVAEALCLQMYLVDVGQRHEDFLAAACVAMNLARSKLAELGPLSVADYLALHQAGVEGGRSRFFSSDT